ncbi:hypothetical protein MKW94_022973 [Papaver nudicaule]|uniref:Protein kinase domain-containing protein n=1 Tax=Papaver nudicaule TaxID=74823 RepID=A0AA41S931_PAPNU|nr:hypothetical protein [Papaver nudicaule]
MNCFACSSRFPVDMDVREDDRSECRSRSSSGNSNSDGAKRTSTRDRFVSKAGPSSAPAANVAATTFAYQELADATDNFKPEFLLGEGENGRIYNGRLQSTGQVVAVKQLNRENGSSSRMFLTEVLMLSLLHHPNTVNLIGYCAEGNRLLLVYEFMPLGSLEDHLHDLPPTKEPLDWNMRMKIAAGAAKGLEYLHDRANPPVIHRNLKLSHILLGEGYHPKISDFGLAKLGPTGDKTHISTRVIGSTAYRDPEYAMTGKLTLKSDIYSFGVVLLELITGRKAVDTTGLLEVKNLVEWARPQFKDRKKFPKMADPLLQGRYPVQGLHQALAVAAMCLQLDAEARPIIGDVVTALSYLSSQTYDPDSTQNNVVVSISAFMEKEARKSNGDSSGRPKKKGWQLR